jgi:hypothetical protein
MVAMLFFVFMVFYYTFGETLITGILIVIVTGASLLSFTYIIFRKKGVFGKKASSDK